MEPQLGYSPTPSPTPETQTLGAHVVRIQAELGCLSGANRFAQRDARFNMLFITMVETRVQYG